MSDTKTPLLALTLHRPWPLAICKLGKRVENRGWEPPKRIIGQWLAIHAGKVFDENAAVAVCCEINSAMPISSRFHPLGIVALVKVTGFTRDEELLTTEQKRWWIGPVGWVLDDVVAFDSPVVAVGKQGLWPVEGEALEKCRVQLAKAIVGGTVLR